MAKRVRTWLRRRRRSTRRWMEWLRGFGRVVRARDPWAARFFIAGLLALGLVACAKQPASIKVKLPRESLQSNKAQPELAPFTKRGDTIRFRASAFDAKGNFMGPAKVRWSVEDPKVASVNLEGTVTILGSGDTKVVAKTEGYDQEFSDGMPIKAVIIDSIAIIGPEKNEVHLGDTLQLKAEVKDDRGQLIPNAKVDWRCSDYAATVSMTGEVEGRAIGDTQVVAEAGGKVARWTVLVLDWRKGAKAQD